MLKILRKIMQVASVVATVAQMVLTALGQRQSDEP